MSAHLVDDLLADDQITDDEKRLAWIIVDGIAALLREQSPDGDALRERLGLQIVVLDLPASDGTRQLHRTLVGQCWDCADKRQRGAR